MTVYLADLMHMFVSFLPNILTDILSVMTSDKSENHQFPFPFRYIPLVTNYSGTLITDFPFSFGEGNLPIIFHSRGS